jgi:hypothetical protein
MKITLKYKQFEVATEIPDNASGVKDTEAITQVLKIQLYKMFAEKEIGDKFEIIKE